MRTTSILGVSVVEEDSAEVIRQIAVQASGHASGYVCVGNAHQYVLASTDRAFGEVLASSEYNTFDSQVIALAIWIKGKRRLRVLRGLELTLALCARAEAMNLRVGFYGTTTDTLDKISSRLRQDFPALDIAFLEAPGMIQFERIVEDLEMCRRINDAGVQLLFVGLGCPKQEKWMHAQRRLLKCTQIGVGAAFDYIANVVPSSPLWIHRCGLEWAYRLCREPRRLWKRYLVTNTMFLWYFAKDLVASRRS